MSFDDASDDDSLQPHVNRLVVSKSWSPIAHEAASHRQRLNELRRAFLTSPICANEGSILSAQSTSPATNIPATRLSSRTLSHAFQVEWVHLSSSCSSSESSNELIGSNSSQPRPPSSLCSTSNLSPMLTSSPDMHLTYSLPYMERLTISLDSSLISPSDNKLTKSSNFSDFSSSCFPSPTTHSPRISPFLSNSQSKNLIDPTARCANIFTCPTQLLSSASHGDDNLSCALIYATQHTPPSSSNATSPLVVLTEQTARDCASSLVRSLCTQPAPLPPHNNDMCTNTACVIVNQQQEQQNPDATNWLAGSTCTALNNINNRLSPTLFAQSNSSDVVEHIQSTSPTKQMDRRVSSHQIVPRRMSERRSSNKPRESIRYVEEKPKTSPKIKEEESELSTDVKQTYSPSRRQSETDRNLAKINRTLKDFTSHLTTIDHTLGQLKRSGSISAYMDTISDIAEVEEEEEKPEDVDVHEAIKSENSESTNSSDAAGSFECLPRTSRYLDRKSMPISSPAVASLTTSSSGWSSSSLMDQFYPERTGHKHSRDDRHSRVSHPVNHLHDRRDTRMTVKRPSEVEVRSVPAITSTVERGSSNDSFSSDRSASSLERHLTRRSSMQKNDYGRSSMRRISGHHLHIPHSHHHQHVSTPELRTSHRYDRSLSPFHGRKQSKRVPSHPHQQTAIAPTSSSSSSGFSGEHTSQFDLQDDVTDLYSRLSNLLLDGHENEARRMLNELLTDSESHSKLKALVYTLGNASGRLSQTELRSSIKLQRHSASRYDSLYHIAQRLVSVGKRHGLYGPHDSLHSLQSHPRLRYTSNASLSSPMHWQQSPFNPTRRSSAQSLSSTCRSIQFIKWPSDNGVEERYPAMKPNPPPTPPSFSKSNILPTPDVLQNLDERAIELAQSNFISFTELTRALTMNLTDEIHIIRSLFIWLVSYDLRYKEFDIAAPSSSLVGILRSIANGQLSRNDLLHQLCRFTGIHNHLITGYLKGYSYRPGMSVKNNGLFHSNWLTVYVGNGWRFINADSAVPKSSNLYSTDSPDINSSVRRPVCDEFYFLTDPGQFIFEHFPDRKEWQLIPKPISSDRFVHLPLIRSAFFNANLSLKKNYGDCLITSNGQVTIKLYMPQFVGISCSLENCADRSVLRGLCLVEVLDQLDTVRIQVSPSQPGKYYLHVYVAPDWHVESDRELACSFQVHCSEHNYSRLIEMGRLPEVGFLGPTPASQTLGILMHTGGSGSFRGGHSFIVHTSTEPVRIPFAIAPGLKLCHQLKSFDRPGHQMIDCDSYALLQMHSTKSGLTVLPQQSQPNAYYLVRMPVEGFYYLSIYATSDADMDTDHLECVYRILIDARRALPPSAVPAFPRQTFWWTHCRLFEPLNQRLTIGQTYSFRLDAPLCDSIAVVIVETDWRFLTCTNQTRGTWSGKINVGDFIGQLSIYGRFWNSTGVIHPSTDNQDDVEDAYVKLLDYVIVD